MKYKGRLPFGDPSELRRLALNGMPPLQDTYSGELAVSIYDKPIGIANGSGRVVDFILSVQGHGQDDDNNLDISGELYINGVTCLTTRPTIGYVSGEASQQKTTAITGDTAITQAAIDTSANEVTRGDVLSYDLIVNSQSSPDAKLHNPCVVVVFEPYDVRD